MRCNICDSLLTTPNFNRDWKDWEPCHTCMEVISDCLSDFKDHAVFYDDDPEETIDVAAIKIPQKDTHLNDFT